MQKKMKLLGECQNLGYGGNNQPSPQQRSQAQPQQEELLKETSETPQSRQNSLLSLTLNEIQLKRGKNLGSMNMDEFLANIWTVDDDDQVLLQQNQTEFTGERVVCHQQPMQLTRQGSFSIPAPLCKKTVDEVWFEIQRDQIEQQNAIHSNQNQAPVRQQTFGEITLEDFLVKAGIVQEPSSISSHVKMATPMHNLDPNYTMQPIVRIQGYSPHQNMVSQLTPANNGFTAYQIYGEAPKVTITNDNGSSHSLMESAGSQQGKKRIIDGPLEVVVERRHRRMIKNRESAARSRARKQAYTVELEHELNQLKKKTPN